MKNVNNYLSDLPTPAYIFDLDALIMKCKTIRSLLPQEIKLCYAMKANPFLVQELINYVDSFEVCSPGEYRICKRCGIPNHKIVLSGVYKCARDIEAIIRDSEQPIYTIESQIQFDLLNRIATKNRKKIQVIIRYSTGNQFGLDECAIKALIHEHHKNESIDWLGIQLYGGTQKKEWNHYRDDLKAMNDLVELFNQKYNLTINLIEYGPGLSVAYFKGEKDLGEEQLHALSEAISSINFSGTISLELGRFLVAECGHFITSIVDIKETKGENYLIVDGGIHHLNYYGQFLGLKKPHVSLISDNVERKLEKKWHVCGSLCTVADVLVKNLVLPKIRLNERLHFLNTGAYSITESMALFLSRDLPFVYFYDKVHGFKCVRENYTTDILNSIKGE